MMYLIFIASLLCLHFCLGEEVQVNIGQGTLSGLVEKTFFYKMDYFAFRGVPYGEPPLGNLRFKPPVPHTGWDEVYEAYTNKPTCMQANTRRRNNEPFGISGSEDCLYINIFTPSLEGSAAVVVFDYNDNFRTGFNGSDTYSPDFFVEENVIVVHISHRLGLFGYLTTEDDVVPGNAGLNDFILGLQWIKNNIQYFGGDPDSITLMGNRGGAVLANILLYSEKAKGLFHKVIIQSGTAFETSFFAKNPRHKAFELGQQFDVNTSDSKTLIEVLQKVDAEQLLLKEDYVIDHNEMEQYQMSIHPFAPTIEPKTCQARVIDELPEKSKIVNDVPVIIGRNSRDGLDFAQHYIFEPRLMNDIKEFLFVFPIRTNFRFDRKSHVYEKAIRSINEFYFKDLYFHVGNILEYAVYVGDVIQNYALDYAAYKLAVSSESNVFYYVFDFRGLLNENSEYMSKHARFAMKNYGATITDELCYLHVCSRMKKKYEVLSKLPSEPSEFRVMKKMVKLWTNFANFGNPTPDINDKILKGISWEPLAKDSEDKNFLHITKQLKLKMNPLGDRSKFWDNFLDEYSKIADFSGLVKDKEIREEL